jgi:alpha-galactosidase
MKVVAKWSELKITGSHRVRDLWRQQDVGLDSDKFEATVAPHGVKLVRIFPASSAI